MENQTIISIIWDADGTLRNLSITGLMKAYTEIIKCARKKPEDFFIDTISFIKWFSNYWWDNMISIGRTDKHFIARTEKKFHSIYDPHIRIFPWVKETITNLSKKEYKQAILTSSKATSIIPGLTEIELLQYFHDIIGNEHVKNMKPNPEGINLILKKQNTTPSNCLIIGDSLYDIKAGQNAGIKTGLVRWGAVEKGLEKWDDIVALKPDYIFEEPNDLIKMLC